METVIIETIVKIVATLLMTLIGIMGTWLTAKIGKKAELASIGAAIAEVTNAAQTTVLELQQTVVDGMKAASADGKLSPDEVNALGVMLINLTIEKLSLPTKDLIDAAGVDITAIIRGAGEAYLAKL